MRYWIIHWLLSGIALVLVAHLVRGIEVSGFGTALIAALVFGLVSATLGIALKIITFPLTLLTFGLFWFVINALMLKLAAALVPGFRVRGFIPAFIGAIALTLVNWLLHVLIL
jgi:putative membrane protein